jgi:hypothetical protein
LDRLNLILLPLGSSIAQMLTKHLELGVARIYSDSTQPEDRFVTHGIKNFTIRRISNSRYRYISPIAHQLSAKSSLTPLALCQSLGEYLPPAIDALSPQMEIECWYTDEGYLCFQLTPASISTWLDYIYTWMADEPIELKYPANVDLSLTLAKPLPQQKPSPCEIVVYAADRCRSVIELAYTEGLITKDISGNWQIPRSIWCNLSSNRGNNRPTAEITHSFESVAEDRLIHALMDILDGICGSRRRDDPRLTIDLAQSWLEFHRHCRIFGDIKRQNPHLAIARCGLTAISERYLRGDGEGSVGAGL